ncbi:MAG: head maturation protease, ClpP-related [Desulfosporosinus sp.]
MVIKIDIKGVIVSNDDKWIYDWFGVDAISPKDISTQIETANGEDIESDINSPGGDVFAGSEIYTAIKSYTGNSTGRIVGIAASAAGIAAMGFKKLMISPTAQIMIHNVASEMMGDYRAHEHEAQILKNYNVSISNAYLLKTGMDQKELLNMMNKEAWLNAQDALEKGFVDEIMFDEGNRLAASISSAMIPAAVINKMRNYLKVNPEGIKARAEPEPKLLDTAALKAKLALELIL